MSNDLLDNRRDLAVKTLQAIFKGVEHWRANSEVDNQVIADAVGFPIADVDAIIGNGKLTNEVAKNDIKDGTLYMYTLEDTAKFCGVAPGKPAVWPKEWSDGGSLEPDTKMVGNFWLHDRCTADPATGLECALVKEAL